MSKERKGKGGVKAKRKPNWQTKEIDCLLDFIQKIKQFSNLLSPMR
jgi:hypothetical protein